MTWRRRGPDPAPQAREKKRPENPGEASLAALEATDWDATKAEVDALRQRMGGMGAVNLVAIEEYSSSGSATFLHGQSSDLTNARRELIASIDEINLTSQKQFEVTFEQIRRNFEYTFQTLFGGGRANIRVDPDGRRPGERDRDRGAALAPS